MLQRRTDLAVEAHDLWKESAARETTLPGVRARDDTREGYPVTRVEILDHQGARALGKPEGQYVTLELSGLERREPEALPRAVRAIAAELTALLGSLPAQAPVLVVGLGNRAITPDAIGPKTVEHTLVTRHLVSGAPEHFAPFRPVAALVAGVLGTTGVESGELARAVAEHIRPSCIIAVDALASRSLKRVCRTVQLSDTGISPGSGVGNHRHPGRRRALRGWGRRSGSGDPYGRRGWAHRHPQGHRRPDGRSLQGTGICHHPGPPAPSHPGGCRALAQLIPISPKTAPFSGLTA